MMDVLVHPDGRTFFSSEDLPPPHWSDSFYDGEDYLSSLKAIEMYPGLSTWIICTANAAAKIAEDGDEQGHCSAIDGRWCIEEEGA